MLRFITFLMILCFVSACSEKSKKSANKAQQDIISQPTDQNIRIKSLSNLTSEEFKEESEFPLVSIDEINLFYEIIFEKIEAGKNITEIETFLWFFLDSVHRNWPEENPQHVLDKLENLAYQNEEFKKIIDIFLESEGIKEISDIEIEDSVSEDNKKTILERRKLIKIQKQLNTKEGLSLLIPNKSEDATTKLAIERYIQKSLRSESIGYPVKANHPETDDQIPPLHWKGSIESQFAGVKIINSNYVPGTKFGAQKEWPSSYGGADGHAYLTANMVTHHLDHGTKYSITLLSEVRGGGKRTITNGFKDKTSHVSFNLVGEAKIPGCDDLRYCSPFLEMRLNKIDPINGSEIRIFLNEVEIKNDIINIDRTQGVNHLKIKVEGYVQHTGKSGAIRDQLAIDLNLNKKLAGPINVTNWKNNFDKELINALNDGNAGLYIFRNLKYLDAYSKLSADLMPLEISVVVAKNDYIINESTNRYLPLIKNLIKEKEKILYKIPLDLISEMYSIATQEDIDDLKITKNNELLKKSLEKIEQSILHQAGFDINLLERPLSKKYLYRSLYKKINDSLLTIFNDLKNEIQSLHIEVAQITHLQKNLKADQKHEIL